MFVARKSVQKWNIFNAKAMKGVEAELCWIEVSGRRHGPAALPAGKKPDKPWKGGCVGRREGVGIS